LARIVNKARDAGTAQDGRVRRGARNRELILEAIFELVQGGQLQPTAEEVAQRAGVGMRTVFRHFADMESLFTEMAARVERELTPVIDFTAIEGTRRQRVHELVRRRARIYERIAPFRRSGNLQRPFSRFLQEKDALGNRVLREQVRQALAAEIEKGGSPLLEALDLVTSFEAWDRLRTDQRLGRKRAERVTQNAVLALLAGFPNRTR
jgi:AcrR family transcriptional regulator